MNLPSARLPHAGAAGFTLIELMVTIAIAAILLMIGVPSFVAFQRNSELTSATNSLVAAISGAKGEAMKRGLSAVVIPRIGSDWSSGWNVFVDANRNQSLEASDKLVMEQGALASYFTASGTGTANGGAPYIMFDPSGYAKTAGAGFGALTITIARNDISGDELAQQTRRVVIAASGRVRACRPATDTTCTSTAVE